MNGFRQQTAPSKKEVIRHLETELQNTQQSLRINQMMTRQLLENNKNMSDDLGKAMGLISELQYKILAIQNVGGFAVDQLAQQADTLRLKDFEEASDNADKADGFTVGNIVTPDSTVILTSTTEDKDKGIFRSRIKLMECGVKDLIDGFMGREVGAKSIVTLNNTVHTVELLGIRQPPVAPANTTVVEAPAAEQA